MMFYVLDMSSFRNLLILNIGKHGKENGYCQESRGAYRGTL